MSANFDPYYKWLGISPKDQPPNHYRLLGLENLEEDLQVIEAAADRQLGFLRRYQSGDYANHCQKLLNEIARARLCLLKPATKAAYDAELREKLEGGDEFPGIEFSEEVDAEATGGLETRTRPQPLKQMLGGLGIVVPAAIGGVLAIVLLIAIAAFRGKPALPVPDVAPNPNERPAQVAKVTPEKSANTTIPEDQNPSIATKSPEIPSDKSDETKAAFYGREKRPKDRKPKRNDLVRRPKAADENKSPLKVGETVDLLSLIDLQRDTIQGKWTRQGNSLVASEDSDDLIAVPYIVPPEYTLTIDLESKVRRSTAYVAFPVQNHQATTIWGNNRGDTDILIVDGVGHIDYHKPRWMNDRATNVEGKVLTDLRSKIVYVVRKNHLQVRVGEKTAYDWRGDFRRFLPIQGMEGHTNQLVIGGHKSGHTFHSLKLQRLPDSRSPFPTPSRPIDNNLLSIINPERDTTLGKWDMDVVLTSMMAIPSSIRFPIELPRNYEVQLIVERKDPGELFEISLPVKRQPTIFALDGYRGTAGGLELPDGKRYDHNSMLFKYESYQLPVGEIKIIRAIVEDSRLTVQIDGQQIFQTSVPDDVQKGTPEVARPNWLTPDEQLQLAITTDSTFDILDVRYRDLDGVSPAFPRIDLAALKKKSNAPAANPDGNSRSNETSISVALPVPELAAREAATKKVREAFATEFSSAKKDADKLALAVKLEALSKESQNDPAAMYACLEMARDLFADAGDVTRAFACVETVCTDFELDALELKSSLTKLLASKVKSPLVSKDFLDKAFPVIESALAAERFSMAAELAALAIPIATKVKDKGYRTEAGEFKKNADALGKEFVIADAARKTLDMNSADPDANLKWGRWLCLRKRNWDEGLPKLAASSDSKLKALAKRDLGVPQDRSARIELGNDWLNFAKSVKDHGEVEFANRSLHWLQSALTQASGSEIGKIEQLMDRALEVRDRNAPIVTATALLEQVEKKVPQGLYTRLAGAGHKSDEPFETISDPPGILIGINCAIGEYGGPRVVKALQPVYITKVGQRLGPWQGSSTDRIERIIEVRARSGYAINGFISQFTAVLDNTQISFARMTRRGLDPQRTYRSAVVGLELKKDVEPSSIFTDTQPLIGLFGYKNAWVLGFGVISTKE